MGVADQKKWKKAVAQHTSAAQKATWVYMLLMMTVFPLLYGWRTNAYTDFTDIKFYFFAVLTAVYFAALLLVLGSALYNRLIGLRDAKLLWTRSTLGQKAFLAYILIASVSALASGYEGAVVWAGAGRHEGLFAILLYGVIFFGVSLFGRPDKWHLLGAALTAAIASVIGLFQYLGFNPLDMYPEGYHFRNVSFLTTMGNTNMVSGMMCVFLPLLAVGFIAVKEKWRWALLPAAFLSMMLEVFAGAESGYVGLGVCLLVMIPLLCNTRERIRDAGLLGMALALAVALASAIQVTVTEPQEGVFAFERGMALGGTAKLCLALAAVCGLISLAAHLAKKPLRLSPNTVSVILAAVILTGLAAGVVFLYRYAADKPELGFVYELSQIMRGNIQDSFGSSRIYIWRMSIPIVQNNLWLGSGPDTFYYEYWRVNRDILGDDYALTTDYAHNDYLQILCDTGIFALLAYLTALVYEAAMMFRNRRDAAVLILGASALCYCVQVFFSFRIAFVAPMFFVVLGALDRRNRDAGGIKKAA